VVREVFAFNKLHHESGCAFVRDEFEYLNNAGVVETHTDLGLAPKPFENEVPFLLQERIETDRLKSKNGFGSAFTRSIDQTRRTATEQTIETIFSDSIELQHSMRHGLTCGWNRSVLRRDLESSRKVFFDVANPTGIERA
jgi:hypothetical protein